MNFKYRINSRNLLKRKRCKVDGDDYNCVLCSLATEEFTYHPLFQCPFSTACWSYLNIRWDHSFYFFDTIAKAKADCQHDSFMEIFAIAAWDIWRQRNDKIFRLVAPSSSWKQQNTYIVQLNNKCIDFLSPLGKTSKTDYLRFLRPFGPLLCTLLTFISYI
jgi:hypothetical protein